MIYKYLKRSSNKIWLTAFSCFSLIGCGYHTPNHTNKLSGYSTISVPYVTGDAEGNFTSILTKTLVDSGSWKYQTFDPEISVIVEIEESKVEDIGYNRHFNQNNQIQRWMDPNERRLSVLLKVSVIEEATQRVILGPTHLSDSVKYDFDEEFSEDNLVGFSLAQYNFYENAERMAYTNLNERLAKVVVDYLVNSW